MFDTTEIRTDSQNRRVYSPRWLGGAYLLADKETEQSVRTYLWVQGAIRFALMVLLLAFVVMPIFRAHGNLPALYASAATILGPWLASWMCDAIFVRRLQLPRIDESHRRGRVVWGLAGACLGVIASIWAYYLGQRNSAIYAGCVFGLGVVVAIAQIVSSSKAKRDQNFPR